MTKWCDLEPDPAMVAALNAAGPRPETGTTGKKRQWGTRFADACAVIFANAVRAHPTFAKFEIRPNPDGSGRESLTGVGGGGKKKVDVIVSTLATGLQVAVSLKAENFAADGRFGRNTLNRIYELQDEVRAVHEYQPRAYVVGVYFMPLAATADKGNPSSFARCVALLRARSGRSDFGAASQLNKIDWSVVGLYVHDGPQRGAVRYFDTSEAPPRFGRPIITSTLTLKNVVDRIAEKYQRDAGDLIDYVDAEND